MLKVESIINYRLREAQPLIDDSQLIQLVKEYDLIYDTTHSDYRNSAKRQKIWKQIAKQIGAGIDPTIVQKRWKVIREKFCVQFRKQISSGVASSYDHYDACHFLIPFVSTIAEKRSSRLSESQDESTLDKNDLDEQLLVELVKGNPNLYDKKNRHFRNSAMRQKSWIEIADSMEISVNSCQRRWRTVRDRFVRELRRTKNFDDESSIGGTKFFQEMLFLTNHVKSKKFEAVMNEVIYTEEDLDMKNDEYEDGSFIGKQEYNLQSTVEVLDSLTCLEGENILEDENYEDHDGSEEMLFTEENVEYLEERNNEATDCNEKIISEVFGSIEENEEVVEDFGFTEEKDYPDSQDEQNYTFKEEDIDDSPILVRVQEMLEMRNEDPTEVYEEIKQETSNVNHKRHITHDILDEPIAKKSDFQTTPDRATSSASEIDTDEDMAFGKMIGCMLKRIPRNMKMTVKLKLMSALADFEAQNNLS